MKLRPAYVNHRVSTKGQEDGFSPEAQKRATDLYCKMHGLYIEKEFAFHETASKWNKRVKFIEMLDLAEKNNIKDIVFEKVDRAVREFNAAIKIEGLIQNGVRFHFIRDGLTVDSNSPSSDKLRFYLQIILSKYYIDNLRDEINKGRTERIQNGLYPGKAPIGYRNVRESKKKSLIVVDDKASAYVITIFELFALGTHSYDSIYQEAHRRHPLLSKSHPVGTSRRYIEKILTNPFYYGAFLLKGTLHKGSHQPLISKRTFDDVQTILQTRANYCK